MKLLVFASGRGSNFEAMIKASKSGYFTKAKIVGLLCDKECPAIEIARTHAIPYSIVKPKDVPALLSEVKKYEPDYLVLAGYMRILPSELMDEYPLRIINVHPSLLPNFIGKDAILQAWEAKVKTTGVTVHFVNDKLDSGPILAQSPVTVPDSLEKLEEEIHKTEHKLYPAVVKDLTEDPFDTLIVSKCLTGSNCRYDGGNKHSRRVEKYIKDFKGKIIEVCPEVEAGFGIPRSTIELVNGRAVMQGSGDVTEKLQSACSKMLEEIKGSKRVLAILKERSPSCGTRTVKGVFSLCLAEAFNTRVFIVTEEDL